MPNPTHYYKGLRRGNWWDVSGDIRGEAPKKRLGSRKAVPRGLAFGLGQFGRSGQHVIPVAGRRPILPARKKAGARGPGSLRQPNVTLQVELAARDADQAKQAGSKHNQSTGLRNGRDSLTRNANVVAGHGE